MKPIKPICLSLVMLIGMLFVSRGEVLPNGGEFRTDINPALLYFQAFLVASEPISDEEWAYLASKKGKEQKLPERFGQILSGFDNQFRLGNDRNRWVSGP